MAAATAGGVSGSGTQDHLSPGGVSKAVLGLCLDDVIASGKLAAMMPGLLLASVGVEAVVAEKRADFSVTRDLRGVRPCWAARQVPADPAGKPSMSGSARTSRWGDVQQRRGGPG